jgi:hypothetical protein
MNGVRSWLLLLAIFAVGLLIGLLETLAHGPRGRETQQKTSIATQVVGDCRSTAPPQRGVQGATTARECATDLR